MSSPFFPVGLGIDHQDDEEVFYTVIERLKAQDALPSHCFLQDIPFFNIPQLSKETQMKELFEKCFNPDLCKELLKNIVPMAEGAQYRMIPQNFSPVSVMSFGQIVLFKVLPCSEANCRNCPREIATHNQYKDFEYECPFYHHERDRRRLVITPNLDEEFAYKANYFEEGRRRGGKEKHSQNYFESMFHPLYYKMFRCKRDFCNQSAFCPFYHSEDEKKVWDNTFRGFIRKDRVSYVKDKQKTSDKKAPRHQDERRDSQEEEAIEKGQMFLDKRAHIRQRYSSRKQNFQQPNNQGYSEDRTESPSFNFEKRFNNFKFEVTADRKDSEDSSFEEKYGYAFFSKLQGAPDFEIY